MKYWLMGGVSALILAGCSPTETDSADTAPGSDSPVETADTGSADTGQQDMAAAAPEIGEWGFDLTGMDRSVDPGDDFYRYANGGWLDRTEIPSDRSNYGMFHVLIDRGEEQILQIITDVSEMDAPEGSIEQQVGDLYASWMDADAIEARGLQPIQPWLADLAAIETHADVIEAFAQLPYDTPIAVFVGTDVNSPRTRIPYVVQSGLSLPDRDYYLDTESEQMEEVRTAFLGYIETLFTLAGIENGANRAQNILDLETRIAEAHYTREQNRDPVALNNELTIEEIEALAPDFDWRALFEARGVGIRDGYQFRQEGALVELAALVGDVPVDTWRDYLTFHFLSDYAGRLPTAFDAAQFDFYSRTLNGIEEQRPRHLRGVNVVNGNLGEAVGQIYVERHFPQSSKDQMDDLVQNLIDAFAIRLENLDWMDDETRAQALVKLEGFLPRIGYPEEWEDYSSIEIRADDYFGNMMRIDQWQWDENLADLDRPVERGEWSYPPQTVNASYRPTENLIFFPAGILQAPFFDPNADAAINYGAIGGVIGHEIGHGFDDSGRNYDAVGAQMSWWTEESDTRFRELTDELVAQFDGFSPLEGVNVNGRFTLGENIGDLGGLQMAYDAYHRHLDACCDGEAPVLDGLTGDQRFFLAWAQVWRRHYRENNLRQRIVSDPHSPSEYRTNGIVRNLDAWYAAFDVTEDDQLYLPPEDRVKVW